MTAKSSPNLPLRNMLRIVRQQKKLTIVLCILYLLGIPLMMGAFMIDQILSSLDKNHPLYNTDLDGLEMYIGIGAFCLGAAVFMGMFVAINTFIEMHKKSQVDMIYALPLTGRQRFFTDFLGGACIYLLPYVITVIIGWILMLGLSCFVNTGNETLAQYLAEPARMYAMYTFGLFVLMLFYFVLSTLLTICCGTLFESIYTNFLLNLLIPGTVAAILGIIADHLDLSFEYLWRVLGFMSPIGGLIYLFAIVEGGDSILGNYYYSGGIHGTETLTHAVLPSYLRWVIAILIISAVLLVAAWQLYVRRKSEYVGKPFVYIGAYYVMLTLLTVLILCMLDLNHGRFFGPVLLFAAIVYFVMEVIRKRGFRRFWLTLITYVLTVALTVGAFFVTIKTGCFGREYYVPLPATVSSVQVAVSYDTHTETFEFTNREVISQITSLHKGLVQRKRGGKSLTEDSVSYLKQNYRYTLEFNSYNGFQTDATYSLNPLTVTTANGTVLDDNITIDTSNLELTYYTIAGTVIHRQMSISLEDRIEIMKIVHSSDLYRKSMPTCLKTELTNHYSEWGDETGTRVISNPFRMEISDASNNNYSQSVSVYGRGAAIDELVSAYERDMQSYQCEEAIRSPLYCTIEDDFPVYESFTETIAVLEKWGFHKFSVPERYDFIDLENPNNQAAAYSGVLAVRIYEPNGWSSQSQKYHNSKVSDYSFNAGGLYVKPDAPAYEDTIHISEMVSLREFYPEMYALLEAAQPRYITEQDCYAVVVNGEFYVVPPEHNDLVEAVLAKGSDYACGDHLDEFWDNWNNSFGGFSGQVYGGTSYDPDYTDDYYENDYEYDTDDEIIIPETVPNEVY